MWAHQVFRAMSTKLVFDCTDTIVGHLTDLMAQWMEEVDKMLESITPSLPQTGALSSVTDE